MNGPALDDHNHTTLTCYKHYGCRRPACIQRNRDYIKRRHRQMGYGAWQPLVDAEPVRAHVRMLMSYGIGWQRIARLADVPQGAVSKLLYGDSKRSLAPSRRVRTATADKLLAVKPALDNAAPRAGVDGAGTRRRLQALIAVGWPGTRLGDRLGETPSNFWDRLRRESGDVSAATARAVRELYEELWDVAPGTVGVHQRYVDQAKAIAARNGWAPPAAWDDDLIDDPQARPAGHCDEVALKRDPLRNEEIRHLAGFGVCPEEIARRVGLSAGDVKGRLEKWRKQGAAA